jgi:hypothetical protein
MGVERMTSTRRNRCVNHEQIIGWSEPGSGMPDVMTTIDRFVRKGIWCDEHDDEIGYYFDTAQFTAFFRMVW